MSIEPGVAADADDERHRVALPGLCNVHSHGFQRGMAGLSERRSRPDDNFWSWREIMYRFLDRLTPEDVAAITAQAYAEMLETRSEEHTSELQSLMRISYAVFCLKKKKHPNIMMTTNHQNS